MKLVDLRALKLLAKIEELGTSKFSDLRTEIRNPKTLSKKLKELVSAGLVSRSKEGYKLTEKGKKALKLMLKLRDLIMERDQIKNIERIPHRIYSSLLRKYCEILREEFGDRLVGVVLFGSVARGDWDRDSDVDLLLVVKGWKRKKVWERLRELSRAREVLRQSKEYQEAVSKGFFPAIQHYPLDPEEAREFHRVYPDLVADGILLYDKEGFMDWILSSFREKLRKLGALRISTPEGRFYWILKEVKAGEVFEI